MVDLKLSGQKRLENLHKNLKINKVRQGKRNSCKYVIILHKAVKVKIRTQETKF